MIEGMGERVKRWVKRMRQKVVMGVAVEAVGREEVTGG